MDLLRRFLLVLFGLLLIALVTVVFLAPEALTPLLGTISEYSAVVRLPVLIVIDVILLILIMLGMRRERSSTTDALMVRSSGVVADVNIESTRERVLKAVREVPDVLSADAIIKSVRGRADLEMDVLVESEGVSIPDKQKEIERALRQVVSKRLGLQFAGRPRIHIRLRSENQPIAPAERLPERTPELEEPVRPLSSMLPREGVAPAREEQVEWTPRVTPREETPPPPPPPPPLIITQPEDQTPPIRQEEAVVEAQPSLIMDDVTTAEADDEGVGKETLVFSDRETRHALVVNTPEPNSVSEDDSMNPLSTEEREKRNDSEDLPRAL